MWGYPEQFMPGYGEYTPYIPAPSRRAGTRPAAARTAPVTGD
jgi:hypothetical protein